MPFDTGVIEIVKAENLMGSASWIERYLMGVAYGCVSGQNSCPSYTTLDETTPSYEMKEVIDRLNKEISRLGLKGEVANCRTLEEMVREIRRIITQTANSKRTNLLDWLVGNESPDFWEAFKTSKAWELDDDALFKFCKELGEKKKASKS